MRVRNISLTAVLLAAALPVAAAGPAAPAASAAPKPAHAPSVEACFVMPVDDAAEAVPVQVLNLGDAASFVLPPDAPAKIAAILCKRDSIVPARNDYKVLAAGYLLSISADARIGALEIQGGLLRYRMIRGELSKPEGSLVAGFLKQAQPHFVDTDPAGSAPKK